MKIVLDTNVIVAAVATRGLCYDVFELCLSEHTILTSRYLLKEVEENLKKKLKLPKTLVDEVCKFLCVEAIILIPSDIPHDSCRDKDDIEVLGTALSGKADAIVTGDDNLLTMESFNSIRILSPRKFWNYVQTKDTENQNYWQSKK